MAEQSRSGETITLPFSEDRLKRIRFISKFHSGLFRGIGSYGHNNFELDVWAETFTPTQPDDLLSLDDAQVERLLVQSSALFYLAEDMGWDFIDFTRFQLHSGGITYDILPGEKKEPRLSDVLHPYGRTERFSDLNEQNHRDVFEKLTAKYTFDGQHAYVYNYESFASSLLNAYPVEEYGDRANVKIAIKTALPVQETAIKRHLQHKFQGDDVLFIDASGFSGGLSRLIAGCTTGRAAHDPHNPSKLLRRLNRYLKESAFTVFVMVVDRLKTTEDMHFVQYLLNASEIRNILLVMFNPPPDFMVFDHVLTEDPPNLLGTRRVLPLTQREEKGNRPKKEREKENGDRAPGGSQELPELEQAHIRRFEKDYAGMHQLLEALKGRIPADQADEYHYLNVIYYDKTGEQEAVDSHLKKITDPLFLYLADTALSDGYIYSGRYDIAEEKLTAAVRAFRRGKHTWYELEACNQLAKLHREMQAFDEAEKLYKNIFIKSEIEHFPLLSAAIAVDLGNLYDTREDFARAEAWYLKALRLYQQQKNKDGILLVRSNLSNVLKYKGDWLTSRRYLKMVLDHDGGRKATIATAIDYFNIAELEYFKRNPREAETFLTEAIGLFEKKGSVLHLIDCELLKLKIHILADQREGEKEKTRLQLKGLHKYRDSLNPDQSILLEIFGLLRDGAPTPPKQALLVETVTRLKSELLRFDITVLLVSTVHLPGLRETLEPLSRRLSKESKNYFYYEYYYVYFHCLPDHRPLTDEEREIFYDVYYFFARNKRRLSRRFKALKTGLEETDSGMDVFQNARLVEDCRQWNVPGDFFNSLVRELRKIAPTAPVRLVIRDADAEVFDFFNGARFDRLTREIIERTFRSSADLNLSPEDIKQVFASDEKIFYFCPNTKGMLWRISETLSGALLLGFPEERYHGHDFRERCGELLKTFASLFTAYYEKEFKLNRKLSWLIGESPSMKRLKQEILRVSKRDFAVLIRGESGSGKELVARGIHSLSHRAVKPFIAVNAAAIPENLLEAELFGYKKGAFTGASESRTGLIEAAHGGTLFLDEIADLPLNLQAKLLRVLQENEIRRLGETRIVSVDFRLVSATNKDLELMMKEGRFREDLFFRIRDLEIKAPPLRERVDDIPLLARHFMEKYGFSVADEAEMPRIIQHLSVRSWPGNIRELESYIKRLITYYPDMDMVGERVEPEAGLAAAHDSLERMMLTQALQDHGGNQTKAAKALKISRQYFITLIKKHKLPPATTTRRLDPLKVPDSQ